MRVQSLAPLLAHSGIDKVISLYNEKATTYYTDIVKEMPLTNEYYYRSASEGDFNIAQTVNEARGINFQEYRTPYYATWTPIKYGIGFAVSTEAEETDYYGVIAKKTKKMLKALTWAKEVDAADFMNLATSSSFLGPDGQPLASASHPLGNGSVASNIVTSGGVSNPALSYTALESAWTQMITMQSDAGNYLGYTGPFELIVGTTLLPYAERLVNTNGIAGTFNLDPSTLKGRITKVVYSPYITSTTAWAIRCIDDDDHGLVMVNRRTKVAHSQYDITKDVDLFTLTAIWCKAIDDWRGFLYSSGLGA